MAVLLKFVDGDIEVAVAVLVDIDHMHLDAVPENSGGERGGGAKAVDAETELVHRGALCQQSGHLAEKVAGGEVIVIGLLTDAVDDHSIDPRGAEKGGGKAVVGADEVLPVMFNNDEGMVGCLRRADVDDVDGAGRETKAAVLHHKGGTGNLERGDAMGDVHHLHPGDVGVEFALDATGKEVGIAPVGG